MQHKPSSWSLIKLLVQITLLAVFLASSSRPQAEALKLPSLFSWMQPQHQQQTATQTTNPNAAQASRSSPPNSGSLFGQTSGAHQVPAVGQYFVSKKVEPLMASDSIFEADRATLTAAHEQLAQPAVVTPTQPPTSSFRKPFQSILMLPSKHNQINIFSGLPKSLFGRFRSNGANKGTGSILTSNSMFAQNQLAQNQQPAQSQQHQILAQLYHPDNSKFFAQLPADHLSMLSGNIEHKQPSNQHSVFPQFHHQRPMATHETRPEVGHNVKHALGFGESGDFDIIENHEPQQVPQHFASSQASGANSQKINSLEETNQISGQPMERPSPIVEFKSPRQQIKHSPEEFVEAPVVAIVDHESQPNAEPEQPTTNSSGPVNQTLSNNQPPQSLNQDDSFASNKTTTTELMASESSNSNNSSAKLEMVPLDGDTLATATEQSTTLSIAAEPTTELSNDLSGSPNSAPSQDSDPNDHNEESSGASSSQDQEQINYQDQVWNTTQPEESGEDSRAQPSQTAAIFFVDPKSAIQSSQLDAQLGSQLAALANNEGNISAEANLESQANNLAASIRQEKTSRQMYGAERSMSPMILTSNGQQPAVRNSQLDAQVDEQNQGSSFVLGSYKGMTRENLDQMTALELARELENSSSQLVRQQPQQIRSNALFHRPTMGIAKATSLLQQAKNLIQLPFAHIAGQSNRQSFRGQPTAQQEDSSLPKDPLINAPSAPRPSMNSFVTFNGRGQSLSMSLLPSGVMKATKSRIQLKPSKQSKFAIHEDQQLLGAQSQRRPVIYGSTRQSSLLWPMSSNNYKQVYEPTTRPLTGDRYNYGGQQSWPSLAAGSSQRSIQSLAQYYPANNQQVDLYMLAQQPHSPKQAKQLFYGSRHEASQQQQQLHNNFAFDQMRRPAASQLNADYLFGAQKLAQFEAANQRRPQISFGQQKIQNTMYHFGRQQQSMADYQTQPTGFSLVVNHNGDHRIPQQGSYFEAQYPSDDSRKYKSGLYQIEPPKLHESRQTAYQQLESASGSRQAEAGQVNGDDSHQQTRANDETRDANADEQVASESPIAEVYQIPLTGTSTKVGASMGVAGESSIGQQKRGQVIDEPASEDNGRHFSETKSLRLSQNVTLYDIEVPQQQLSGQTDYNDDERSSSGHRMQSPHNRRYKNLRLGKETSRQEAQQSQPRPSFGNYHDFAHQNVAHQIGQIGRFPVPYMAPPSITETQLHQVRGQVAQQPALRAAYGNDYGRRPQESANQISWTQQTQQSLASPALSIQTIDDESSSEQQAAEAITQALANAGQQYFQYQPVVIAQQQQLQQQLPVQQLQSLAPNQADDQVAQQSPRAQQFVLAIQHQVADPQASSNLLSSQQQTESTSGQQQQADQADNSQAFQPANSNGATQIGDESIASSQPTVGDTEDESQSQQDSQNNQQQQVQTNEKQQQESSQRPVSLAGQQALSPSVFCANKAAGLYADETQLCKAYYQCAPTGHQMFRCNNQTQFNQKTQNCDWWYNVNCGGRLSSDQEPNFSAEGTRQSAKSDQNQEQAQQSPQQTNQESRGNSELNQDFGADQTRQSSETPKRQAALPRSKINPWFSIERQPSSSASGDLSSSSTNQINSSTIAPRNVQSQEQQMPVDQQAAPTSATPIYSARPHEQQSSPMNQEQSFVAQSTTTQEPQQYSVTNGAADSQLEAGSTLSNLATLPEPKPQVGANLGDERQQPQLSTSASQIGGQEPAQGSDESTATTSTSQISESLANSQPSNTTDSSTSEPAISSDTRLGARQHQLEESSSGEQNKANEGKRVIHSEFGMGVQQANADADHQASGLKSARSPTRFEFTRFNSFLSPGDRSGQMTLPINNDLSQALAGYLFGEHDGADAAASQSQLRYSNHKYSFGEQAAAAAALESSPEASATTITTSTTTSAYSTTSANQQPTSGQAPSGGPPNVHFLTAKGIQEATDAATSATNSASSMDKGPSTNLRGSEQRLERRFGARLMANKQSAGSSAGNRSDQPTEGSIATMTSLDQTANEIVVGERGSRMISEQTDRLIKA